MSSASLSGSFPVSSHRIRASQPHLVISSPQPPAMGFPQAAASPSEWTLQLDVPQQPFLLLPTVSASHSWPIRSFTESFLLVGAFSLSDKILSSLRVEAV